MSVSVAGLGTAFISMSRLPTCLQVWSPGAQNPALLLREFLARVQGLDQSMTHGLDRSVAHGLDWSLAHGLDWSLAHGLDEPMIHGLDWSPVTHNFALFTSGLDALIS